MNESKSVAIIRCHKTQWQRVMATDLDVKERCRNNFTLLAASFIPIFSFKISHYINITPDFKEKTRNKISYPKM